MQNQITKDWQKVKLGEYADVKGGKRLPMGFSVQDKETNHLYLRIVDMNEAGLDTSDIKYISDEVFKRISRYTISDKDLYISIAGTIGFVGKIPQFLSGTNLTENCAKICNFSENLDRDFLLYFLKSYQGKAEIKAGTGGSSQPKLALCRIENFQLALPPKGLQQKIASILSNFDNKIEVNNKIAKTLEEIAQVLFKEWFVKFKFPRYENVEFKDSELGKIPKDWELKPFEKVAINFDRKRKPLSSMERIDKKGRYPYFGATEIMDHIDEYIFDGEYLLIAEDGTVETDDGKAVLQFIEGKFWVNNHAHIIQGTNEAPTFYLYLIFRNISIKPYITGAVQLKLTQENLNKIPVIISSSDVMKQFINIVYPMILKIRKCQEENQKLAALRDLLLPKLIKGEIKV